MSVSTFAHQKDLSNLLFCGEAENVLALQSLKENKSPKDQKTSELLSHVSDVVVDIFEDYPSQSEELSDAEIDAEIIASEAFIKELHDVAKRTKEVAAKIPPLRAKIAAYRQSLEAEKIKTLESNYRLAQALEKHEGKKKEARKRKIRASDKQKFYKELRAVSNDTQMHHHVKIAKLSRQKKFAKAAYKRAFQAEKAQKKSEKMLTVEKEKVLRNQEHLQNLRKIGKKIDTAEASIEQAVGKLFDQSVPKKIKIKTRQVLRST